METDPYEEDMEDVRLDNEREHHWRMVFNDNNGGVDDDKMVLNSKKWDFYMKITKVIIKVGCYVEVPVSDGNKAI